ncbi:MAG: hypothetical protein J0I01_15155 [Stenotrophomonas nitritireducens]|uniref:acyl-CoA reductase n=1 Tax=Stenotrophomonas nitritireducens TaxID=83617 RepID=UPI001AC58BBE|nr:acyl-CoA reductase [Stenotrophomonas nitritireducens]MBN8793561.1 hypothetical protein [Stenotrophomonas nitritireducens]MBN8797132.1 hypothetical protein [Stenotrophomonas nitritireducens]
MIRILFSVDGDAPLDAQLSRLGGLAPLPPFSVQARAFVTDFARRVFALPVLREHPELATLAHWFRPAAQEHLSRRLQAPDNEHLLARGLVFHLAPANVDVLFAYAWLMSVLAGNRNVARLSQKPSAQREALVSILHAMQAEGLHGEILQRSVLLTYPHDDAVTTLLSRHCHARIIWGGDATVAKIRSLPLAPLAVELAFPDRFGVCAIRANTVLEADDNQLPELAHRFSNDVLWFGQQACSSPRTVYWIGDPIQIQAAKARFWNCVKSLARQLEDEPAALMARVTDAHLLAATVGPLELSGALGDYPLTLQSAHADGEQREMQSGHGLVIDVELADLPSLAGQLDDRDQTLVQHGFSREELLALTANLQNRAIDRIVPLGRALDFHPVWDGSDLMDTLTRKITLPAA